MRQDYNQSNESVNNFKFLTVDNHGYKLVIMNMAQRIQQRMDEIGMTQEALAKLIGATQPSIYKLLSGKTRRSTRLPEIARALGVRLEWLLDGIEPKEQKIKKEDQMFISKYLDLPEERKAAFRVLVLGDSPPGRETPRPSANL